MLIRGFEIETVGSAPKSPVSLPVQTIGNYSIRHDVIEAGRPMPMIGGLGAMRSATDTTIQQLSIGGNCWMSDSPSEMRDMAQLVSHVRGDNVLVAGLGMGIVAEMAINLEGVKSVTVVEISSEVIAITSPHIDPRIKVIHADFREWVKTADTSVYTSALLDIWGDISTDDLPDMIGLWKATNVRRGDIWGLDFLFMQLQDQLRDEFSYIEELADEIHGKYPAISDYMLEYWTDDFLEDIDQELLETFANVYGLEMLL